MIGVPTTEWGETVVAVVEPRDGEAPSDELAAELIDHCRARLARFKCPRRVDFIDHLPHRQRQALQAPAARRVPRQGRAGDMKRGFTSTGYGGKVETS